jgi:hypothetical protein
MVELKPPPPPPLLAKCIDVGGSLAAEGLIEDWPQSDLVALLEEVEQYALKAEAHLSEGYKREALRPEYFFSKSASKALDDSFYHARFHLIGALSEISGAAQRVLFDNHGIKIPFPEEEQTNPENG